MKKLANMSLHLILFLFFISSGSLSNALAGQFSAKISNVEGKPVRDAVVSLTPIGPDASKRKISLNKTATMDQIYNEFDPHVLPVQVGTSVHFPNSDNIHHHVYSFSKAKLFELKLYSSTETKTVTFDKPGVVVLGCNIHDWMIGYVYVADTPHFLKSNAQGEILISDVPSGNYRMDVWHPRLKGDPKSLAKEIVISDSAAYKTDITLLLKKKKKKNI